MRISISSGGWTEEHGQRLAQQVRILVVGISTLEVKRDERVAGRASGLEELTLIRERLAPVEAFRVAARRVRLHAAEAGQRQEEVFGEPMPSRCEGKCVSRVPTFWFEIDSLRWKKTLGDPRSPSYLGISYSRIR